MLIAVRYLLAVICAVSVSYIVSASSIEEYRYDENTKYYLAKTALGFNLEVAYSAYQFWPSPQKILGPCIEATLTIAELVSKSESIAIQPIGANNVQTSFSRSFMGGTSTCKALVDVRWQQKLISF